MTQDQEGREHQQVKEVWSLWQMLLKKIVVKHVKNFVEPREQKRRRKTRKNRPQLLVAGSLILYEKARPHVSDVVTKTLRVYGWEVLLQSPYSPDMSPQDFNLFPKIKETLRGWRFSSPEEFSSDGTRAIRHMNKIGVLDGIMKVDSHYT